MAIAYDVNFDMLRILEISCVNGTHQISVRGVSADLRVVKYANTTLIWGSVLVHSFCVRNGSYEVFSLFRNANTQ